MRDFSKGRASQEAPAAPSSPTEDDAAGLDAAQHIAAQRTAHRADILVNKFVPICMATALATGGHFDPPAFRCYLDGLLNDAGNPTHPLQKMLIEQVVFAHLRLADLHVQAAAAKTTEAIKILNGVCARMLGEIRRTVLTVDALRENEKPTAPKLRVAKTG
jgi:hypothetical protein